MICEVHGRNIVRLEKTEYHDGNLCVLAVWDDGERHPISVNIPDQAINLMQTGEFFLKNWTEAEDLAIAILASGAVVDSGATVPTGYVQAPIVRLASDIDDDDGFIAEN